MAHKQRYTITTLTPIWTGGAARLCDRIHETSIIGGLRFWYEVILRGLGYTACDPTSDDRCPEKDENGKYTWCDACDLFGCTGVRRKFRLVVEGGEQIYKMKGGADTFNMRPQGRHNGWFRGAGIISSIESPISLSIVHLDLRPDYNELTSLAMDIVLHYCVSNTGLGARLQHGFGFVKCNETKPDLEALITILDKLRKRDTRRELDMSGLPTLNEFFFKSVKFSLGTPSHDTWWKKIDGGPDSAAVLEHITKANTDLSNPNRLIAQAAERYLKYILPRTINILSTYPGERYIPIAPAIRNLIRFGLVNPQVLGLQAFIKTNYDRKSETMIRDIFGRNGQSADDHNYGSRISISDAYPVGNASYVFRVWGWITQAVIRNEIVRIINEVTNPLVGQVIFGTSATVKLL